MAKTQLRKKDDSTNTISPPQNQPYWGLFDFYQEMSREWLNYCQDFLGVMGQFSPVNLDEGLTKEWFENFHYWLEQIDTEMMDINAYERLVKVWAKIWTKHLETYMGSTLKTREFVGGSEKTLEALTDLKLLRDVILEAWWYAIRLPNRRDMRELYYKDYTIERKLDELNKKFNAIQHQLDTIVVLLPKQLQPTGK